MADAESPDETEEPVDEDDALDGEIVDEQSKPDPQIFRGQIIQTWTIGPAPRYPPPDDLRKYEEIQPGFTDRILSLTELETAHRVRREEKQDDAKISLAHRGQWFAFIIVLILVCGGIAAILAGHSVAGTAGVGVGGAAIAGAFIAPRLFSNQSAPLPGTEIEPPPEASVEGYGDDS